MPHFRVDDALHSHPKARQAGLEAMGLWNMCGSWCMGYLTDGFVPEWYVKTWPKGPALAKRLVAVRMWVPAEKDGEKGWQFHEFTGPGRNDSRQQVEESREKWRKKKAGQREDSPRVSPRDSEGDTNGDTPRDSLRVTRDPTQPNPTEKLSGDVSQSATEPDASGIAATIGAQLLDQAGIDPSLPVAAELRKIATDLVKSGRSAPADVVEGLVDWNSKTGIGPGVLRSLISDVVKRRNGHARPTHALPHKLRAYAELAAEERATEQTRSARKELSQ